MLADDDVPPPPAASRAPFAKRHPRATAVGRWVLFALVTVVAATLVSVAVVELVDPASDGRIGTAVITTCDYNHGTYRECFGRFDSTDGTLHYVGTRIFGEDYGAAGQSFTAYADPNGGTVAVSTSSQERWTDVYFAMVFIMVWGLVFGLVIYLPWKRRKAVRLNYADAGSVPAPVMRVLLWICFALTSAALIAAIAATALRLGGPFNEGGIIPATVLIGWLAVLWVAQFLLRVYLPRQRRRRLTRRAVLDDLLRRYPSKPDA